MDTPENHSVLEYARSHGVASNLASINPLEFLDQTCRPSSTTDSPHRDLQFSFDDSIISFHKSIEQSLRSEKLDIDKDDGRFLSTIIRKAKVENLATKTTIDHLLPSLNRLDKLKLEPPLLRADCELDLLSLKRRSLHSSDVIKPSLVQKELEHLQHLSHQWKFEDITNEIEDELRRERLDCTKESLKLIQNAKRSGELSIHGHIKRSLDQHRVGKQTISIELC